jgi:class 3 adenylate cyclase
MEQEIRYCTAPDGVRIAYATAGAGAPLVKTANWLGHLEFEWRSPVWRHWLEAFTDGHLLVRYDERGNGLSDRKFEDWSLEAYVRDLETVVDTVGVDRFALLGWSQGVAVSIAYAVRHPERVSHLVLYGGGTGPGRRVQSASDAERAEFAALMTLARAGWERLNAPYRQIFTNLMIPDATPEQSRWMDELARIAISGENFVRFLETFATIDVVDLLPRVNVPTLVLHARDDRAVPFEAARELAAAIPEARLVTIASRNHFLLEQDPGWRTFIDEVHRFLGAPSSSARLERPEALPTATVLFTDMEGSTPLTQRLGDAAAHEFVREHTTVVRRALSLHGGREIKQTGDGIMASFASASRALECAVEIQSASAMQPDQPRVRVGLNAGEPIAEDGDLFGSTVQLARRICDRAEPGEVLASDVVRQLAAGKGFLFADAGAPSLKGFDEPVRLYSVRWRGDG